MIFFSSSANSKYEKVFYDFSIKSINGEMINLSKDKNFVVIGVPSNSFNQEKDNEKEIKEFCEVNFNISFPMTSIYQVKGDNAHEIYKWAKDNHGKSAIPKWNFYKILINKNGKVEDTYSSLTNPNSNKLRKKINMLIE